MRINIKCVHCKAQDYTKEGFRKTQNRGKVQKYKCHSCNRYFTNDDGFYKMKNCPKKITKAIDLYFSNLSSRKVRNNFKRRETTKISHKSVLDWCRRYTLKVKKYVDSIKPSISGQCYADETEINRSGKRDNFWVSIDWGTRYINGIHYSPTTDVKEAIKFLKDITKHDLPKYIQTDGAKFYPKAFKKSFYSRKTKGLIVEHRIQNVRRTKVHNYKIETVFMKIKDRVDDFRGLKQLWSAPILMTGIVLQHNFIEEHTTTGEIPCDLAQMNIGSKQNRWLSLIYASSF